ncbi:adenosylcobinamide-GDP ribazoletransferase [Ornithinimicrobium sp. LYQ103]|uniref:adenosylcobinamide-GDP ribazoletransferase n=1 Tax=Ornithinimicrobium sp. LYQ103 TaxID=3378796 RepID=UPI00385275EB
MRSLLDAVAFLTRVPVPVDHRRVPDLARAAAWFPVVGALLGAGLVLLAVALSGWTSVLVAVVLLVVVETAVTGALHLDGLADLADGTGGGDREARLRIMKDHATGVYGTAAVVLALLLEVALLAELVPATGWVDAAVLGAAAWSLSRAAMLPVALLLPYARAEGTGRGVVDGLAVRHTAVGWVVPLVLCAALGWTGMAMLAGALVGAGGVGWLAHRWLGGATGDVLGATAQVALLGSLLGASLVA